MSTPVAVMLERVIPKGGSSGTTSSAPRWYTSRTTVLALFPVPAVTVTFARGISSGLSLIPAVTVKLASSAACATHHVWSESTRHVS